MPYELGEKLVVGLSSRALFDLEDENAIFETHGVDAYRAHQRRHEQTVLAPGAAFPVIRALLALNERLGEPLVEVVVMSRNSPDTGLRVFRSIEHYELPITRAAFTGGESLASYLGAFEVDLFLSKSAADVQAAIDNGVAAATLYAPPDELELRDDQIRIAFDGDAVLFSDESERIFKEQGLEAFWAHEQAHKDTNLPEGPFAKLLKTLSLVQDKFKPERSPVVVAIVTARNRPAHERVIQTLRAWGVDVDEAFFLGGVAKDRVLQAFGAHIFFDDQHTHLAPASRYVPSGHVPYASEASGE